MKKKLSVDDAIKTGHWIVTYPCAFIFIGGILLSFFIADTIPILPIWLTIIIAIVLFFSLAWLYWSVMVVKWKVWAFTELKNVHELKLKAIRENLLYADGAYFNKFEWFSKSDAIKWKSILQKFELPDEIEDDNSLPTEYAIYLSKYKLIESIGIALSTITLGIVIMINKQDEILKWIASVCIVFGSAYLYKKIKNYRTNKLQLIINNIGIVWINKPIIKWEDIYNENILKEGVGNSTTHYLQYSTPDEVIKIRVDSLVISVNELERILKVYRKRNL